MQARVRTFLSKTSLKYTGVLLKKKLHAFTLTTFVWVFYYIFFSSKNIITCVTLKMNQPVCETYTIKQVFKINFKVEQKTYLLFLPNTPSSTLFLMFYLLLTDILKIWIVD